MIRVLLVDDQELVRTGFAMILGSEATIDVVGQAGDGVEAIEWLAGNACDVVLMDVRMPKMDGVEATAKIAAMPDGPRVMILTTFNLDEYVLSALRNGASGFLLKDTPAAELVDAVHIVAAGDALLAPAVTRTLIANFREQTPLGSPATVPGLDDLTEREHEVLVELARGRSNAEIGEALFVSEATIKTHVGRVLTKLGVRDRVQAVVLAYESGIITPGAS